MKLTKDMMFDEMLSLLKDLEKVGMSIRAGSIIWEDIRRIIEFAEKVK